MRPGRCLSIFGILVLVVLSGAVKAQELDLAGGIRRIDRLFEHYAANIHNETRADTADEQVLWATIDQLHELERRYPGEYQVLWRLARSYLEYGKYSADPGEAYEQGIKYAEKTIGLYPGEPQGYFWKASLLLAEGNSKGLFGQLSMLKDVRDLLKRCIKEDPEYAEAYNVMAVLYLKAPGWPLSFGNKGRAEEYMQRAIELKPESFSYRWNLYQIYKEWDKEGKAKEVLKQILTMTPSPERTGFSEYYKAKARKALDKM